MNLPAIYHTSGGSYCYPMDENRLFIKVKTGKEVTDVILTWGDPFEAGLFGRDVEWKGADVSMCNTARLRDHKIWTAVVEPRYKRCRYYFIVKTLNEKYYYTENGFLTPDQFDNYKGRRQDFFFPWMNSSDIIKPAPWVNDTVWYQIFPERFCSSGRNTGMKFHKWAGPDKKVAYNHFYGGDLKGVESRLDYLKELGVTGIYFTPVNQSVSNHKYDTTDYTKIDEDFGTNEDMKALVKAAHERGIRVMLDGVFNHCGYEFAPWQDVLKNGADSEYADWFMVNTFPLSKKRGMAHRGEYYSFAFADRMPKLNMNNDKVIDHFIDICRDWVKEYDIDAIRLDVADELSHRFNKRLRGAMLELKEDFYICGEMWHDASAWLQGDEYDAVMNYTLQENIESFWRNESFTANDFMYGVYDCMNRYASQTTDVMFNLLDSHDTPRLITRCDGDADAFYQELCALFTLNGTVCFYYGTEVRLEGSYDPDCRRCMPWSNIDSGMYDDRIAEMKKLIDMRKDNPQLRRGGLRFVSSGSDRVIVYDKYDDERTLRVILNCSGRDYDIGEYTSAVYARGLEGARLAHGGSAVVEVNTL